MAYPISYQWNLRFALFAVTRPSIDEIWYVKYRYVYVQGLTESNCDHKELFLWIICWARFYVILGVASCLEWYKLMVDKEHISICSHQPYSFWPFGGPNSLSSAQNSIASLYFTHYSFRWRRNEFHGKPCSPDGRRWPCIRKLDLFLCQSRSLRV